MINKKSEWNSSREKWGFGRVKIDNFLDEETVHQLYEECKNDSKRWLDSVYSCWFKNGRV